MSTLITNCPLSFLNSESLTHTIHEYKYLKKNTVIVDRLAVLTYSNTAIQISKKYSHC